MTGPTAINTGTCTPWIQGEDAFTCCPDLTTSDTAIIDSAAQQASDLLYILSGRQYPGICETVVRPCASNRSCWYPHLTNWHTSDCSCQPLSYIRLAGYPVREILEVSIDGVILSPAEYRLDRDRELVRLADADGNRQFWPRCQRLDINEGVGTFFVHYSYGLEPPVAGQAAAAQLACAIAKACPGTTGVDLECDLPAGTVRVARQGVTIETQALGLWLLGQLRTGMPLVDAFLSGYGNARKRRTALSVPEMDPWPLRVVG